MGAMLGLSSLFQRSAEHEDTEMLNSVKEVRSKSEFARTAPLALKAGAGNRCEQRAMRKPSVVHLELLAL